MPRQRDEFVLVTDDDHGGDVGSAQDVHGVPAGRDGPLRPGDGLGPGGFRHARHVCQDVGLPDARGGPHQGRRRPGDDPAALRVVEDQVGEPTALFGPLGGVGRAPGGQQGQGADTVRMAAQEGHRHVAAHRAAGEGDGVDALPVEFPGQVVGHEIEGGWLVRRRSRAETALVGGDDVVGTGGSFRATASHMDESRGRAWSRTTGRPPVASPAPGPPCSVPRVVPYAAPCSVPCAAPRRVALTAAPPVPHPRRTAVCARVVRCSVASPEPPGRAADRAPGRP